jgi:hypothetical protein
MMFGELVQGLQGLQVKGLQSRSMTARLFIDSKISHEGCVLWSEAGIVDSIVRSCASGQTVNSITASSSAPLALPFLHSSFIAVGCHARSTVLALIFSFPSSSFTRNALHTHTHTCTHTLTHTQVYTCTHTGWQTHRQNTQVMRVRTAPQRLQLYDDKASSAIREWCITFNVSKCVSKVLR